MDHKTLEEELNKMLGNVVLPEDSEVREQCIYRVQPNIRQVNPEAYTPKVVSIGPFHNPRKGDKILKPMKRDNVLVPMEELKQKYLKAFLSRTTVSMGQFVLKLKEWESRIRSCYAGLVNYNSNDFLKMMLIDACFIIEYFLRCCTYEDWKEKDPILFNIWLLENILLDLLLLENQLPFFLLDDIYNLAGMDTQFPSFLSITLAILDNFNKQKINPEGVYPKHFTDLLRTFMLPPSFVQGTTGKSGIIEHLYSATQLSEAGLIFEVNQQSKCFLDLEFHKGKCKSVLRMPCFHVHDTTERHLRNVLAFEECQYFGNRCIAQYLRILDCLINSEKDVNILIDKKIIVNEMGDANAAATMLNNLQKNNITPYLNSNNLTICKSLNDFYTNSCNKYMAIFIHEYCNTPWKIASTIAALLLLLLTLIQTICSVISAFKGK